MKWKQSKYCCALIYGFIIFIFIKFKLVSTGAFVMDSLLIQKRNGWWKFKVDCCTFRKVNYLSDNEDFTCIMGNCNSQIFYHNECVQTYHYLACTWSSEMGLAWIWDVFFQLVVYYRQILIQWSPCYTAPLTKGHPPHKARYAMH